MAKSKKKKCVYRSNKSRKICIYLYQTDLHAEEKIKMKLQALCVRIIIRREKVDSSRAHVVQVLPNQIFHTHRKKYHLIAKHVAKMKNSEFTDIIQNR